MDEEKNIAEKFKSVEKFISELIGYHEQIKQLKASEVHYKELAAHLGETLKKYQAIVDHLPLKFFLKDKNLSYLLGSESYSRFLGIAPQEISGKTDHDFYPSEVAAQRLNEDRIFLEKAPRMKKKKGTSWTGKRRSKRRSNIPSKTRPARLWESGEFLGTSAKKRKKKRNCEEKTGNWLP